MGGRNLRVNMKIKKKKKHDWHFEGFGHERGRGHGHGHACRTSKMFCFCFFLPWECERARERREKGGVVTVATEARSLVGHPCFVNTSGQKEGSYGNLRAWGTAGEHYENVAITLESHSPEALGYILCLFVHLCLVSLSAFSFFFSFVPPVFQALIGCGEDASWVCRQLPLIAQNTLQTHSKITLQNKAGP